MFEKSSSTMDGSVVEQPAKGWMRYFTFQQKLVWVNVIGITTLHLVALYYVLFVIYSAPLIAYAWGILLGQLTGLGVTAGAHRLWTHRTYKAKLPLRIFLMIVYIMAGQYSMESWVRDHRTHHKFSDTDADPHNIQRGFFFSHCGWLMMKRHPDVKSKGKLIDISDVTQDPVVKFQQKYFVPLHIFLFILLPSVIPYYFWNVPLKHVIFGVFIFRYVLQLNFTWSVNSFAHFNGSKPYNKNIRAVQNRAVSFFTQGEGWHNFHHVFPWDYRIGEYGQGLQVSAMFIEFCAYLGLAYDLKSASPEMVARVKDKQGMLMQNEEMPAPEDAVVEKKKDV